MSGPLAGRRIVNTRAANQAAELDTLLRAAGAIPVSFPCIAIEPVADPGPLDAALRMMFDGAYDWVLFTSVNTVRAVESRLRAIERRCLEWRWRLRGGCRRNPRQPSTRRLKRLRSGGPAGCPQRRYRSSEPPCTRR